MFNVPEKVPHITDNMVIPILTSEQLFSKARYQSLIKDLRSYAQLPDEHFEVLYIDLLNRFAEFVQLIPSQPRGALGGLLNMGLARGVLAIEYYIAHHGKAALDALQCYAVFTAGLLLDISRVAVNQKVIITDAKGNYETTWRPFMGSMYHLGKYYRLMDIAPAYRRLEVPINSILARQIMPETGFLWLSSHWRVFSDWLDALNQGGAGGERIAHLISLLKLEDILALLEQLQGFQVDVLEPDANEHGERFLRWLKTQIDKGELRVNTPDALIHVIEDGVFVDKQLFKQYADLIKSPVNIQVVFTQFGNLIGAVKRSGQDYLFANYHSVDEKIGKKVGFMGGAKRAGVKAEGVRVPVEILLKKLRGVSQYIRIASKQTKSSIPKLGNSKQSTMRVNQSKK